MFFFEKSTTNGVAINNDEYVPTNTPIIKAKENPLMDSPPNIKIVSKTKNVLNEVFIVLDKWLNIYQTLFL